MESTQKSFFKERLAEAVDLLTNKELVVFLGAGTSEAIGGYGELYYANLSIPALKIADPSNYPSTMFSPRFLAQTCFIVTSISGETHEVIEYMEHLKAANATILSICQTDASTIAKLANLNIPYTVTRETVQKNYRDPEKETEITTQLPAVFILEKLAQSLHAATHIPTLTGGD
nr:SIS domain-containing protein [Lacticaseibacillus absianus]